MITVWTVCFFFFKEYTWRRERTPVAVRCRHHCRPAVGTIRCAARADRTRPAILTQSWRNGVRWTTAVAASPAASDRWPRPRRWPAIASYPAAERSRRSCVRTASNTCWPSPGYRWPYRRINRHLDLSGHRCGIRSPTTRRTRQSADIRPGPNSSRPSR